MSKLPTGEEVVIEWTRGQLDEDVDSEKAEISLSLLLLGATCDVAHQLERIADSIAYFETKERCKGKS